MPSQSVSLLDLPPEVRTQIWQYSIEAYHFIVNFWQGSWDGYCQVQMRENWDRQQYWVPVSIQQRPWLLATCKQTREEALPVYYSKLSLECWLGYYSKGWKRPPGAFTSTRACLDMDRIEHVEVKDTVTSPWKAYQAVIDKFPSLSTFTIHGTRLAARLPEGSDSFAHEVKQIMARQSDSIPLDEFYKWFMHSGRLSWDPDYGERGTLQYDEFEDWLNELRGKERSFRLLFECFISHHDNQQRYVR